MANYGFFVPYIWLMSQLAKTLRKSSVIICSTFVCVFGISIYICGFGCIFICIWIFVYLVGLLSVFVWIDESIAAELSRSSVLVTQQTPRNLFYTTNHNFPRFWDKKEKKTKSILSLLLGSMYIWSLLNQLNRS